MSDGVSHTAIATAKTMPAGFVPDALKEALEKAGHTLPRGGSAVTKDASTPDTPNQPLALPRPEVPPGRSGWLWIVITIVAAIVGMVFGAIMGSKH